MTSLVNLYDESNTMLGVISPLSCTVTETLNEGDGMELSACYDDQGLWKNIKPGARIGVYVQRCVPDTDIFSAVFSEKYIVSELEIDALRVYDGPGEDAQVLGNALPGTDISITGYDSDTGRYQVRSVQCYGEHSFENAWIGAAVPEIKRTYSPQSVHYFDAAYSEQIYAVQTVNFGADRYSIEAIHETIDMGAHVLYMNDSFSGHEYAKIISLYALISDVKQKIAQSGQLYTGDIARLCVGESAAVRRLGWAVSVNELLTSKLKETYEYDILRSGNSVYLYDTIGSDRGAVLEVGRNLASLEIVMSREDGDLDGVYAYCTHPENGTVMYAASDEGASPISNATRHDAVQDSSAASVFTQENENAVLSRLKITADAYMRSNRYKGRATYRITVTPEIAQMDGAQDVPIVLGDIVTIRDPRLPNGEIVKRVTARQQDAITGRITALTVGDLPFTLYDVIKKMR